ncbi:MAG: cytochrome C oxidase subunit IV family protein [Candidatus Saccharimonadia bacterium]
MSKVTTSSRTSQNKEHGTATSYAVGFIISLALTILPYYLVVSKPISGNTLLATILGYAIFQMLIQVLFFLHLGRGPKPFYNIVFFGSTVMMILVVVGGSLFIMAHLVHYSSEAEIVANLTQNEGISQVEGNVTGACQQVNANHQITFKGGQISPTSLKASLCDTITFYNGDTTSREVVFGTNPNQSYGGNSQLFLGQAQSVTITLNQSGTFEFHDSLHPGVTGSFTVNKK